MKFKFEITIARVEGAGDGPFEYQIALDSMVQQLFDTDTFEIYGDGSFALSVFVNDEDIGGVRFPMGLLKGHRTLWLPLGLPYVELTSLPTDVSGTRVYLSILEMTMLSPVVERQEYSEYSPLSSLTDEYTGKDLYIEALNTELEAKNNIFKQLTTALENSEAQLKAYREAETSCQQRLAEVTWKNQQEEAALSQKVKELQTQLQELTRKKEERRKVLATMQCPQVNGELKFEPQLFHVGTYFESEDKRKELHTQLKNVKFSEPAPVKSTQLFLEKENQHLLTKIQELTDAIKVSEEKVLALTLNSEGDSANDALMKEFYSLSEQVAAVKQDKTQLANQLEAFKEENAQFKEVIEYLRLELSKQEEETCELTEQLRVATQKRREKQDLDQLLKEYMKSTGVSNPFIKVAEGVYSFKNRRVNLSLKNGVPVVRVGGGYLFIEEFMKDFLAQNRRPADLCEGSLDSPSKFNKDHRVQSVGKFPRTPSHELQSSLKKLRTPRR